MFTSRFAHFLAHLQRSKPWWFLVASLLSTVVALSVASRLRFDPSYDALLPEGAPQIQNVREIREKTGGTRTLVIAISGDDVDARGNDGASATPSRRRGDPLSALSRLQARIIHRLREEVST